MKRSILILLTFLIGTALSFSQSLTVISPQAKDIWQQGKTYDITWKKKGDMDSDVKIRLFNSTGTVQILKISNSAPNNNRFRWTIPVSVSDGKYVVRVKTTDNKFSDDSDIFLIKKGGSGLIIKGVLEYKDPLTTVIPKILKNSQKSFPPGQNIIFHSPKSGYVWVPLKTYDVSFEVPSKNRPLNLVHFDVKLVSANTFFNAIYLKKNWYVSLGINNSRLYKFQWKFQGSYNIPSGKYKIVVQSVSSTNLRAESEVFEVKNVINNNFGFVNESEGDLKLEDVFYDTQRKGIYASVRNIGFGPYKGNFSLGFNIKLGSLAYNSCPTGKKIEDTAEFKNVTFYKQQNKIFKLLDLNNCFDIPTGKFTSRTSPIKYTVNLFSDYKQLGTKTGWICNTKKPEVLTSSPFFIHTKNNNSVYVHHKQKVTISPDNFNWVSKTEFKTRVEVRVGNNGCSPKTFDLTLTMNGPWLNGRRSIRLGSMTLGIGERKNFLSQPIIFSIPKNSNYERILLVAYPGEERDEGYPNAYMNNFILGNIRLQQKEGVHVEGVL